MVKAEVKFFEMQFTCLLELLKLNKGYEIWWHGISHNENSEPSKIHIPKIKLKSNVCKVLIVLVLPYLESYLILQEDIFMWSKWWEISNERRA